MKAHIYTAIMGNSACNAHCPFCISRMTPKMDIAQKVLNTLMSFCEVKQ